MSSTPKPESGAAITAQRSAEHMLSEIERTRRERDSADARMARSIETFELVIAVLPRSQQEKLRKRLQEITSDAPSQRRGAEAYGKIVSLFENTPNQEWTVPSVMAALGKEDAPPDDQKAVYNALGFLEKSGRLIRIGRGRYFVRDWGIGYETADDLPDDGTTRATEHDV